MYDDDGHEVFGLGQGCAVHGDEEMTECRMCGLEFCRICFPGMSVCPGCTEEDDDDEDDPDFEDVDNLDELLEDDEEVENILREADDDDADDDEPDEDAEDR